MASNDQIADREERLKSALWYSIGQFVDASALDSDTLNTDFNATPQFIGALTELVYGQIEKSARDLELFAKHAGRNVIAADDVMLLTRRNEALETVLRQEMEGMRAAEGRGSAANERPKKRGRPGGTAKVKAKP